MKKPFNNMKNSTKYYPEPEDILVEEEEEEEDLDSDEEDLDSDEEDLDSDEEDLDSDEEDLDSDEEETIITIEGEETDEPEDDDNSAPAWVKELRSEYRKQKRENRRLRAEIEKTKAPEPEVAEPGPRPKIEDFDWDTAKFDRALDDWYRAKSEHEKVLNDRKADKERQEKEWQNTMDSYAKKKKELKVRNFNEAEENVADHLSTSQQGMILQAAENPAALIYALGMNPKLLEEVSSIKDPVKFAFRVAKLEPKLNMTTRKASTKPERRIGGGGGASGQKHLSDSKLARLEEEASLTGDRTKVIAYKRKLKAKNK